MTITSTTAIWTLQNFGFDGKLVGNYACFMAWVNQLLFFFFFPHKTFLKIFRKLIPIGRLLTFISIYELHSFLLFFISPYSASSYYHSDHPTPKKERLIQN